MNTSKPRIIFIDGFNTVGKDYFIKQLELALPKPIKLSDPRVWLPEFQQSKRYWDFIYRSSEQNNDIFNAHLQHLQHLRELLDTLEHRDHVLVTNRSFVTALNYNFLPTHHNERVIGGDNFARQRYFEFYRNLIQGFFSDVPTLMVNLHQFHDLPAQATRPQTIAQVRARMQARVPGTLINDYYLDYLIDAYQNPSQDVRSIYTHWEDVTSSDASAVVQKYFT